MDKSLKLEIFLKKSKLRKAVWSNLTNAKTPSEIAKELSKCRSSVSRILIDMEKEGFVKCVNPEDSSFRHYIKR